MESAVLMLLVQGTLQRAGVGALHHLCPDRFHCPAGDGREHRAAPATPAPLAFSPEQSQVPPVLLTGTGMPFQPSRMQAHQLQSS